MQVRESGKRLLIYTADPANKLQHLFIPLPLNWLKPVSKDRLIPAVKK